MNLLHPSSAGEAVSLWFVNGAPARLIHGDTRYRVTEAQQWTDASGWTIAAQGANGQPARFSVRASMHGWKLSSAG